jgi:hypothetical protein
MTPERRKYILDLLARATSKTVQWIRISEDEFDSFGGSGFFQGCTYGWEHGKYYNTTAGQKGWTKNEYVELPWKITAPHGGWSPKYPHGNAINEGNTMEHHVNREKIIEGLTEAKVKYQDLYTRFKDLYFGVATARLSAYVDGEIPHTSPILPCDDKGVIGLYPEQSDRYDDMILAMQLDVREVIEMTEGEFEAFAEHKGVDNSPTLTEAIERLERLA